MRPLLFLTIVVLAVAPALSEPLDVETFITDAPDPATYILSRLRTHPVVIFGEAHWIREEVTLVRDLVPALPDTGVRTLAIEVLQASMQPTIDEVVSAEQWDESRAMAIVREAGMPWEEYLQIVEAVWAARRVHGNDSLQLLALGPGHDWRDRLPAGETYDSFMASRVKDALAEGRGSVLVYTGLHHAFTRYMQPETTLDGRARAFMIRTGNILRWDLGERVFTITMHRPIPCGAGEQWEHCEPLGGVIDCAASRTGARPFGFDVATSPFATLRFGPRDLYVPGYPDLRLVDFVDGLVWFAPPDALHPTTLVPLDRYAPTDDAIQRLESSNPFDDRTGLSFEDLEQLWKDESERLSKPMLEGRWHGVGDWKRFCAGVQP